MDRDLKARLSWVRLYEQVKDAGVVCRRCGVSRPTLRKWLRRYGEQGLAGLRSLSRRPRRSPRQKVFAQQRKVIRMLRQKRRLGARRIQSELRRSFEISLGLATIHKVLGELKTKLLKRTFSRRNVHRYSRSIPGDRVQLDTCKIAPRLFQFTAIDDCTRMRVLALYPRRTAANTLLFIEKMVEEFPFPIQRIQTDRGTEFFAETVQERFSEYCIKFRPIRPRSPHLNGKVERSQRTDLEEFYPTVKLRSPSLPDRLQEWQHYYNWERPHGALNGKPPIDRYFEVQDTTPEAEQVEAAFLQKNEPLRIRNYGMEIAVKTLKRCL